MKQQFNEVSDQAVETYNSAYHTARRNPGTVAAIVVGLGITAALVWAARRSGGLRNLQTEAMDRMRQGYDYVREGYGSAREMIEDQASRLKKQSQNYVE